MTGFSEFVFAAAVVGFGTFVIMQPGASKPDAQTAQIQDDLQLIPVSAEIVPDGYKIEITAKRIPTECKSLGENASADLIATCQPLLDGSTKMTMTPKNGQFASVPSVMSLR